jgi:hypothetical protein
MRHLRSIAVGTAMIALGACQTVQQGAGSGDGATAPQAAAKPAPVTARYLCCNLHTESDWFSDGNFYVGRLYPAGTPITLKDTRRGVAFFEVDGRPMRLGQEYGRQQESFDKFLDKYLVTADPRAKLASAPPAVRQAIQASRLTKGMTKEQVLMSIGYPPTHGTASLDAAEWKYWYNRFTTYVVLFDQQGRLREIVAEPGMRALLMPQ